MGISWEDATRRVAQAMLARSGRAVLDDGVTRAELGVEDGKLFRRLSNPKETAMLDATARMRAYDAPAPSTMIAWLQIPPEILRALKRANPELDAVDVAVRHRAWIKFAESPEAEPFRVWRRPGHNARAKA